MNNTQLLRLLEAIQELNKALDKCIESSTEARKTLAEIDFKALFNE